MLSSPREEARAAGIAPVTRCPACGRRVARHEPVCPAHGFLQRGAELESARLPTVSRPRFPGYGAVWLLGQGGFGTVFGARSETGDRRVAIKLARADRAEADLQLSHEIEALRCVGPPHVPAVYAQGSIEGGSRYVVMEYLEARTLADRMTAVADPIPLPFVCASSIAILRALQAIHERGYVHRDIKPENIFVDDEPSATIVDFGLVVPAAPASAEPVTSPEGAGPGTADYMAPEQCEGRPDIDARADLYAMGVILYELITGHPPFWGPPAIVHQSHLGRRPPRFAAVTERSAIPVTLEAIVLRCLAKERHERFESAAALRVALEGVLRELAAPTPTAPAEASLPPMSSRTRGIYRRERRTLSLLFFEAEVDMMTLQERLLPLGGHLAHVADGRCVVVHGLDAGENPARLALSTAQALLREGLCQRVWLDLGSVAIQNGRAGSKRFLSPLFGRVERYPSREDPLGLVVKPAASAVLPDAEGATGESLDELETGTGDPRTGPFFGRDEVVSALIADADRAAAQAIPSIAIVIAEVGHGKSRLWSVLNARLRLLDPEAEVLEIRAREPELGGAEQTIRELLQRALDLPREAPADGGVALLRERLGVLEGVDVGPAIALALGWVLADDPASGLRRGLSALAAAPGALRAALTVGAGEALRRRAAARPLFVILDDAHFADEATLGALEYAALAEGGARIWVCALARPSFERAHPSWGERAGHHRAHHLGPLDPASAGAMCRWLLAPIDNVPDAAVAQLVQRSECSPLLLGELVRGIQRQGLVRPHAKGRAWYLATDELDRLPDVPLIEWLAHAELDAHSLSLQAHARLLALLGAEVRPEDVDGVLRALELSGDAAELPLDPKIATWRLVASGLLVQRPEGRVAFRHTLVREVIARSTPQGLRHGIHLAAVEHYGGDARDADDHRLAQLAFHAAEAGLGGIAEEAYLQLAERMRARHAYAEAERLYSRALDLPHEDDDPRRRHASRGRGLMRYRSGRYHDALTDFACARRHAVRAADRAAELEILLDEATVLDWMDEYKSSEARVEQASALLPEARSPLLEARLLLGRGRSLHRFSREEEAAATLERAAVAAARLGDEGYETRVIARLMLGFIHQGLGRLDEGSAALDDVVALCEAHGDTFHLAGTFNNRALLRALLGQKEEMIADLSRCLSIARNLGQRSLELMAEFNLGEYLYLMADLEAAEPHVRRALALDVQLSGGEGRPVVVLLEARLRLYRGDEGAARTLVARIRARQAEASEQGRSDALMVPSEDVLCAMVELSTRDADAQAWDELIARSASCSVGQEHLEVLEARAIAAERRGRHEEARLGLERAIERAARIPNVMAGRLRRRLAQVSQGGA